MTIDSIIKLNIRSEICYLMNFWPFSIKPVEFFSN